MCYLYNIFYATKHSRGKMHDNAHHVVEKKRISIKEFGNFLKFYDKDQNEQLSSDIFMLLTKKLAAMLIDTKPSDDDINDLTQTQGKLGLSN